jgi:general stress protein 26
VEEDVGAQRKELDFKKKKEELIRFLESKDNAVMVLATSHGGQALARNVLIASDGLDLYLFTWKHSRKCAQIQANPRVALCKDNVQIEGIAEVLGDLLAEEIKKYTDILRGRFPDAIKQWEHRPAMVIIRVRPTFVVVGASTDPPCLEYLDLGNEAAYAEQWACY